MLLIQYEIKNKSNTFKNTTVGNKNNYYNSSDYRYYK